jgi:diguanylate cyclase (GGDEF)-like protein/PAS domain S-box-containing protein
MTVLILGVALTFTLFLLARDAEQVSLQRELDTWAADHAAAVQSAIDRSIQVIGSLRRFYLASDKVEAREFQSFVEPALGQYPYLQALEWAPRVVQAERETFEAAVRAEGLAGFRITEQAEDGEMVAAAPRAEYFPLRYLAPLADNEAVLGFDIAAQPLRGPILEAARDSGTAQISEVFTPIQGANGQLAFVILSPVYRNGLPQATPEQRRAALDGYVLGLVRAGDLVETALRGTAASGLDFDLYDETVADAPVRMHTRPSRLQSAADAAVPDGQGLRQALVLEVPGRRWVLHFRATPEFIAAHYGHLPEFILAVGLVFSLLSSAYLYSVLRRKAHVIQLAGELAQSNRLLQAASEHLENLIKAAPMAVIAIDREERVTEWNPAAERMFGWPRDEVLGHPPPHIDPADIELYAPVREGKTVTHVEELRRRKDGSELYVRAAGAPLRDGAGAVTGMMAVVEDMSDLHHAQEVARRLGAMLEALNQAAQTLLQSVHWSPVMPEVLRALGEAAGVDRVYLFANHAAEDGALLTSQLHEWCGADIGPQVDNPALQGVPYGEAGLGRWADLLGRGEVIQGDVADFPEAERSLLAPQGVVSLLVVPVRVDDEWWGFIGFDACRARREWGREEVRLLCTAAEGLGAAIRRERYEQQLQQSALVFENTVESVIITDAEARILDVNPAFTEITGYSREEAIGRKPDIIKSERHDLDFYRAMWSVLLRDGLWRGEIWDRRKNGESFPARLTISAVTGQTDKPSHYVGVLTDLTAIRETQDKLEYLSQHDPLTDLPNRRLLAMQLGQAIKRAARADEQLALLFIDLDRFKDVNDSLGHPAGDELLQQVARRLQDSVRDEDQVARHGGDEFLVLLEQVNEAEGAAVAAQKLLNALAQPFRVGEHELLINASIGISLYPADGADAETLLRNVDAALFRAKELGRGRYEFYTEDLTGRAYERMSLVTQLARAQDEGQLQLYYQPQVDLETGQIIGAEALLRWMHPEQGMISPVKFIPLAEESGLIVPIGEWVLRTACATARAWCEGDSGFRRIAVNVAGPQLTPEFVDTVREVLVETGLSPACLELEVTEGFIMGHAEGAIDLLNDLKALGVELAIDDFGTGYSSLSYLKRLPIDKLKIDQSFVRGMPDPDDEAIARAVIALGKSLGQRIIAEGVETEGQRDFLKSEGCDEGQGYLYSKPIPADEFAALFKTGT